jgi:ABC-type polysaccharide/polyol phosphate export permease
LADRVRAVPVRAADHLRPGHRVLAHGNLIYDTAGQLVLAADYRDWLALNPFAGIVQGFRAAILGEPLQWLQLTSAIVFSVVLLVAGLLYFKRVERRFADIA